MNIIISVTNYLVINTVVVTEVRLDFVISLDIFVRLSNFIHQTSRCILLESSNETDYPSIISLSSRGDDPHYARVTPQFALMITYATFFVG